MSVGAGWPAIAPSTTFDRLDFLLFLLAPASWYRAWPTAPARNCSTARARRGATTRRMAIWRVLLDDERLRFRDPKGRSRGCFAGEVKPCNTARMLRFGRLKPAPYNQGQCARGRARDRAAGGRCRRAARPLTRDRAKPAVYFGGPYRIIDFVLNCINSGLRRVFCRHASTSALPQPPRAPGHGAWSPRSWASSSRSCRRRSASASSGTQVPLTRSTRTSTRSSASRRAAW